MGEDGDISLPEHLPEGSTRLIHTINFSMSDLRKDIADRIAKQFPGMLPEERDNLAGMSIEVMVGLGNSAVYQGLVEQGVKIASRVSVQPYARVSSQVPGSSIHYD